ncbi:MAG: LPXTG cell wall anchor domain-containing protein [Ruminococcus sp.]|nr:LPXTG cell wall anchor domain-containing protein [Ruminococcus sp.]
MIKRIISIALVAVMIFAMAVVAASAAEVNDANVGADSNVSAGADTSSATSGAGNRIYFDPTGWKNYTTIFCHIWERGGDSFFPWQSKSHERCQKEGSLYYYDLSELDKSTTISGGLQNGKDYCVIFSANTGVQCYDTTFGKACIGDTAKMTGKKIENPVDSTKEAFESVWTKNSGSYGPHLAITSIGNIVGSKLCPNEKGAEVIGDWLPTYYKSVNVNATDALAKAFPKFGIKSSDDIQVIYAYILSKKTGEDEDAMLKVLENSFKKAYPSKKAAKIDKNKAKEVSEKIKKNGGSTSAVTSGSGTTTGGSTGSTNSSGSGSDGQEDTIFFVLAGVMLAAAGVMFVSRRRRTE